MARPAMFLENCGTSDPTLGFRRRRSRECVKPSASTSSPLSRAGPGTQEKILERDEHDLRGARADNTRRVVQRGRAAREGTNHSTRAVFISLLSLFLTLSPSSHWPRGSWHEKYSLNACLASLMPRASAVPASKLPPPRSWDDTGAAAAALFVEEPPPPPLAPPRAAAPAPVAAPAARKKGKIEQQGTRPGEESGAQPTLRWGSAAE